MLRCLLGWGCHRRNIRFPAAPAGDQFADKVDWCRWQRLGAPPPPITIVGGCKSDGFESPGGSQNRPLAARLGPGSEGMRAGTGSGGRVHPRTRAGGGARRIQVLAQRGRRRRWEGPEWRPQEAAGTELLRSQVPACSRRKRGRLSSKRAEFEDK